MQHNVNLAVGVEASSTHYNGNSFTQRGYYHEPRQEVRHFHS
jgi:hypothetical protein